ncbi:MAG: hypothetical protein PHR20_06050 [Bacteroidales bacterium]|nr:hypothetical protein [Bacteroidales bacterium]
MIHIESFIIRASYPSYFMLNLFAKSGRIAFEEANELEGNKPGTVIYRLQGEDVDREIPPKWYDIFSLLNNDEETSRHYLELLVGEQRGDVSVAEELETLRREEYARSKKYVDSHKLTESDLIITPLTSRKDMTEVEVSHKGKMLLDLTRNGYAVPDFCILSAKAFTEANQQSLIVKSLKNMECMTGCKLGSDENPLVLALRSAMPQYIPGLMPTLLNIGVNRKAYQGLIKKYGKQMANRIYLGTLHSIFDMLFIEGQFAEKDGALSLKQQSDRIVEMESMIIEKEHAETLLEDSFIQVLKFVEYIRDFYVNNQDLLSTFMQGRVTFPSLIMQKMVWTIGNQYSFPGVLYSRNSRTGSGIQIEYLPDIFGDDIMTGDVSSYNFEYDKRGTIKDIFPAIYHFDPLMKKLEKRYHTPVTIEFGVETHTNKSTLFAILQLNESELTGRAALISSIDMYENNLISENDVVNLIRPYHLRQIFSDRINDESMAKLKMFSYGVNVLPRTAVTAQICFNTSKATELRKKGVPVCLCKNRFVPEDTIILNEMNAIISMSPAAIHVVTACRGYGIPAMLNLESFGNVLSENTLVNKEGDEIHDGDWITISSKLKTIFKGKAQYEPARFMAYLNGEKIVMDSDKEASAFRNIKTAYEKYNKIVRSAKVNYITDINMLTRLIRYDLQSQPETAAEVVNSWYDANPEKYLEQVLESRMGSHQDQFRVFTLLEGAKKTYFFKQAVNACTYRKLSGLTAGAFILGRFVAHRLPFEFWHSMSSMEIAYILNEYVLYEKYLQVLFEVGETKLTRVHSQIVSEGMMNYDVKKFDIENFDTLKQANPQWGEVKESVNNLISPQENTKKLIDILSA